MSGAGSAPRRLGVGDLGAFWAEGPGTPMQIALVAEVDAGSVPAGDSLAFLRDALERRLDREPLLRRRVRWLRFGQGRPVWVDDARFDVADHVTLTRGSFVDDAGWLDWCAYRAVEPLARDRPLWQLDVVEGLPDGRVGLLLVVHHAVVDGLSGVAAITRLLDPVPNLLAEPSTWRPAPPPTGWDLVKDNAGERIRAARGALRDIGDVRRLVIAGAGTRDVVRVRAPRTSLSRPLGATRRLAVVCRPLEDVRAAAHARQVTVNDLLLAAVSAGLRDLLESRGDRLDGLVLRASMPIAVRGRGPNQGRMAVVPLPVGDPDAARRLEQIAEVTRRLKDEGNAARTDVTHIDILGSPLFPFSLARVGIWWLRRHSAERINLYVTNVPGPTAPLWLAGARVERVVPIAPLIAAVPLGVAAMSYAGELAVSLHADGTTTDLPVLAAGVASALDSWRTSRLAPTPPAPSR